MKVDVYFGPAGTPDFRGTIEIEGRGQTMSTPPYYDEDVCDKCGAETPETQEEYDEEGWSIIAGEEFCKTCALEKFGQKRLFEVKS